jgi:hypothetical protein
MGSGVGKSGVLLVTDASDDWDGRCRDRAHDRLTVER